MKTGIYVKQVHPPYLSLEFQESTCKTVCEMKNLQNIELVKSLSDLKDYKNIVIYSLICLGDTLAEIIDVIKKLMDDNIQLISVVDPINLNNFGQDATENMLLSVAIGSALKTNEVWKSIQDYKNKKNENNL